MFALKRSNSIFVKIFFSKSIILFLLIKEIELLGIVSKKGFFLSIKKLIILSFFIKLIISFDNKICSSTE